MNNSRDPLPQLYPFRISPGSQPARTGQLTAGTDTDGIRRTGSIPGVFHRDEDTSHRLSSGGNAKIA